MPMMRGTHFATALIRKLRVSNIISETDEAALRALPIAGRYYGPNQKVVSDGDKPLQCCLLVDGFLVRSKSTKTGQKQILSIHIAGEIPDLQSLHLHTMDHDISTLTGCTLGFISHGDLRQLCAERPDVAAALWRETLVDAAIFREWIVNVGRRSAPERMAHLILELWSRLEPVGRTFDGSFELPLTQSDLADCLGLTPVHVNRVLKQLRENRLLEMVHREYRLLDRSRLSEVAQFEPSYLHQSPCI